MPQLETGFGELMHELFPGKRLREKTCQVRFARHAAHHFGGPLHVISLHWM